MTEPLNVVKYGASMKLSPEAVAGLQRSAEAFRGIPAAFERALNATPEERAEWRRQAELREAEEARQRADERAAVVPVPLSMGALLAKMGWSREYAEHLVQPYCACGDDIDGWTYCQHAQDLGLAP